MKPYFFAIAAKSPCRSLRGRDLLSGYLTRVKCCSKAVAASFVMRVVLGAAAVDVAAPVDGVGVVLIGNLPSQSNKKKR